MQINFDNTYVNLPGNFYTPTKPIPVANPHLIFFNWRLASELGINVEKTETEKITDVFSGNIVLEGSNPIALAYAGCQFGYFVPQLGDGRAVLLGEVVDKEGARYDIQLKGSGKTPYSRRGDGRATLGPMLREYLVSEAMHGLKIKTSRSLALVMTGESVFREAMLPGAILTRVASSHIRVGTFEYFATKNDFSSLKTLADYAIDRHAPHLKDSRNPYSSFLEVILEMQTSLVVDWMRVGFIHGVMNTDNTAISGETIDYGPCAFLDEYVSDKVFSSIDIHKRYAFDKQAGICLWNFSRLSHTLISLLHDDIKIARTKIKKLESFFVETFNQKYLNMMANKIGLLIFNEEDGPCIQDLLNIMEESHLDYTLTFRYLIHVIEQKPTTLFKDFVVSPRFQKWIEEWKLRLASQKASVEKVVELMSAQNPIFIPRNHRIEKVITHALEDNDFSKADMLLKAISNPYQYNEECIDFALPPTPQQKVYQTFCGT